MTFGTAYGWPLFFRILRFWMTIIATVPDALHKVEPSWNGDLAVGSRV